MIYPITEREKQVLSCVANGNTIKQTARQLIVSEHTIHTHLASIYRKWNCHNRVRAIVIAITNGVIK